MASRENLGPRELNGHFGAFLCVRDYVRVLSRPCWAIFLCFLGQLTVNVVKPHILQAAKGGPKASIEEAMLKSKSGTQASNGGPKASPDEASTVGKSRTQAAEGGPKASIEGAMLKCKSGTRAAPPQASPEDGLVVVKTSSQAAKGRPKASTNQALPILKSRTQAAHAGPKAASEELLPMFKSRTQAGPKAFRKEASPVVKSGTQLTKPHEPPIAASSSAAGKKPKRDKTPEVAPTGGKSCCSVSGFNVHVETQNNNNNNVVEKPELEPAAAGEFEKISVDFTKNIQSTPPGK